MIGSQYCGQELTLLRVRSQVSVCVVDDGQLLIARKLDSAKPGGKSKRDVHVVVDSAEPSLSFAAFAATQLNEFCFLHFRDWGKVYWLLF